MNKHLSAVVAVALALVGLFVFSGGVKSDTAVSFGAVSGTDNTLGAQRAFTSAELAKLSASDNSRIQTDGNWPMTGAYDENKYLEFVFTPNLSASASVSSAAITHEYYRTNALVGAKLEVWDGTVWHDVPISLPQTSGTAGEISQTLDITSLVPTPALLNSIKIRFLAYRSTVVQSGIKTSHDFIQLAVNYSIPTPSPTQTSSPTDSATLTPTPSDVISSPASASETITPTPTPDVSVSPTPEATDTPTPIFTPFIFLTPEPEVPPAPDDTPLPASLSFQTPSPSPMASPSFSPTPEATQSASFEPTPNPLIAVIAPPKVFHRKIKATPLPSVAPVVFIRPPSPVHQIGMKVVDIWHLFTYYLNMLRR